MTKISPLSFEVARDKSNALRKLLDDLCKEMGNGDLEKYAKVLSGIYSNGYRQMYSDIYPMLLDIYRYDNTALDMVIENLTSIRKYVGSTYKEDENSDDKHEYDEELYGKILKLTDHINLEYQRLRENLSLENAQDDVRALLKQNEKQVINLNNSVGSIKKTIDKEVEQANSLKIEVVSILAIFAAIVIAFSGGLTFTSNLMSAVTSADIFRTICIGSICGLVLFNTLALLLVTTYCVIRSSRNSFMGSLREVRHMPLTPVYVACNVILIVIFIGSLIIDQGWIN